MNEVQARAAKNERTLVTTLTKRMAEDLTDYMTQKGVRVRYLHSEIETIERTEIIRKLRLGEFDCLVGINLLREGLDIPEVSLVGDTGRGQGGLPAERDLAHTDHGRAARNVDGTVILYCERRPRRSTTQLRKPTGAARCRRSSTGSTESRQRRFKACLRLAARAGLRKRRRRTFRATSCARLQSTSRLRCSALLRTLTSSG